jgi:hypothetical protein
MDDDEKLSERCTLAQMGRHAPAEMTEVEAFAAVALGAVACDGVLGKDEAHALRRQLEYRSPYKDRSEEEMAALFDTLLAVLREQGIDSLIEQAIPQLNPDQQETALAVAAQLMHADRRVAASEADFLHKLGSRLTLPEGRAQAVIDAIMALNRDSLAD